MTKRILVSASTFPASATDSVPAFVKDQLIAMKHVDPSLDLHILAPHDNRSHTADTTNHADFTEYRFHYMWPFQFEKLAGQGGIMPQIKANPLYYLLIPFLFIGEFIALYRLTKQLRPDYLYAHWFTPQGVTSAWVSRLTNTPFVFTTHAADVDVWHKIPFVGRAIVRSHAKRAAAITAVSPRSLAKLERFFTADEWQMVRERTKIIPMGVSLSPHPSSQSPNELKQRYDVAEAKVILFMGRLAEKKGVRYLLQAVAAMNDPSLQLVIAGDGPLKSSLKRMADDLGISSQTRFVGYVSGEEKADYLALADVVVLPSIITDDGDAEGLPVVFMEALAAGKICIATNESGADNIIEHGKSGFLLPHKDIDALTATIPTALALSSEQKIAMQTKAQKTAQQFDWATVARSHLDFFDEQLS